ncbi:MAG: hypothetical protein IJH83_00645 [Coriobacteriales bacterium]|nr:hypothetical protein [Coriobacteriales bacterium]
MRKQHHGARVIAICAICCITGALALGLSGCGYNDTIEGAGGTHFDSPLQVVIADQDGVTVTITQFDEEGGRYRIKVDIQNGSDQGLFFTAENASINGLMSQTPWKEYVPANDAKTSRIRWDATLLESYGIDSVEKIDFTLVATAAADGKRVFELPVLQYPNGKTGNYDYEYSGSGIPVFDQDGLKMQVIGIERMGYLGYTLTIYMENDSAQDVAFQMNTALAGDNMNVPLWSNTVKSGTAAYTVVSWPRDRVSGGETLANDQLVLPMQVVTIDGNEVLLQEVFQVTIPAEMVPAH